MPEPPPTNGELLSRVVAIEAGLSAFKDLMEERDRRYKERALSQDNAVKSALDTSDKAITKAELATEKRLEGLNELRDMAADQSALLMPRAEYNVQHQVLLDRMQLFEKTISITHGRGVGVKEAWSYIIALAAIFMAGIVEFFRH